MSKFTPAYRRQTIHHGLHLFKNRRAFWQMIREALQGHYRMSALTMLILVLSVAYIVFPFDLIPDYIPVVGWLDDAAVLYFLLWRLVKETHRYNRFKAIERKTLAQEK